MFEKSTVYIIHHDDDDGRCAAAIVANYYDKYSFEIKFEAVNYGKENLNFDMLKVEDEVWIVDFTCENMVKVIEEVNMRISEPLVWIDHHKTAMEKFSDLWCDPDIPGFRSLEKSACELTWEYIHGKDPEMPEAVQYVGDRDMWEFENPFTKTFCAGLSAMIKTPDDERWEALLDNDEDMIYQVMASGKALLEAQNFRVEKAFERGRDFLFHGLRARLINSTTDPSEIGEFVYSKDEYDIAVIWQVIEDTAVFSLRSNTVDCSELAQKYGGGGHKGAAGFRITNIDFPLLFFGPGKKIGCKSLEGSEQLCETCTLGDMPNECERFQHKNDREPVYE